MAPRGQLPAELIDALSNGHNSKDISIEGTMLRSKHTGKLLGCWAKVQLVVRLHGCSEHRQHYKKLELQALSAAYKKHGPSCVWCPICTGEDKLMAACMQVPSREHAHVVGWLAAQCAHAFYIEHAVDCYGLWHGLVDAYFPMQHLCLQVDGKQHMAGEQMYHEEHDAQLQRDVAFNVAAWRGCLRTLRMHHQDGGPNGQHTMQAVLEWCAEHPGKPVLVLSYSFAGAHVRVPTAEGVECSVLYPQYMAALLGAHVHADKYGRCWLHDALT
jgi:hypothetical protein